MLYSRRLQGVRHDLVTKNNNRLFFQKYCEDKLYILLKRNEDLCFSKSCNKFLSSNYAYLLLTVSTWEKLSYWTYFRGGNRALNLFSVFYYRTFWHTARLKEYVHHPDSTVSFFVIVCHIYLLSHFLYVRWSRLQFSPTFC